MPIPKPNTDEVKEDFMTRCMSDSIMVSDYEENQRAGVCETSWNDNQEDDSSKKAIVSGSTRDLENRIDKIFREQSLGRNDIWVQDIKPDQPIKGGKAYVQDFNLNKNYEIPFTDENGTITLGESVEVQPVITYEPVAKIRTIVSKDEAKREVTTPVMIPDCKDCDGESFTVDEVAKFCREYNAQFRLADKMHVLNGKGDVIGDSVENWTLKADETVTNVLGETVTLPMGTWMTTIKVNDDDTWKEVENGTLKGASGMYVPRITADELLKNFTGEKRVTKICECVAADKRTKITEIDDPVAISIALVDRPCVANAIATSIKTADKAGRSISNANYGTLQKAYDKLVDGVNNFKKLLDKAENERADPLNTDGTVTTVNTSINSTKEVDDMNEDEVKELIKKQVEDARKEDKETIGSLKSEIEELKKDPEPPATPAEKTDEEKQAEQEKAWKQYNDELENSPVIKEIKDGLQGISDKLGIDPAKKALEGQEEESENDTSYKGREDRDAFGRKIREA